MKKHDDEKSREAGTAAGKRDGEKSPTHRSRSGAAQGRGKKKSRTQGAAHRMKKHRPPTPRSAKTRSAQGPQTAPPSVFPQPSLDSFEEGGAGESQRPEQEPPPPTAYGPEPGEIRGEADDLFEYVV
ncbi:MAG TPA: hypothetical protein VKW04_22390 [Planctomycetota bacterium]|nr:hypothetical protein [Planctomycetota bacterium]